MNFTPTKWQMEMVIASIRSLISIDSYFEKWDDVKLWEEQLADAEQEYAKAYPA